MSAKIGFPRLEYPSVTSTMDIAREEAARGASHGTLITAAHQTSGRGRRGATWSDTPGDSALMTFVLRPDIELKNVWRLPFIASLACVRYLRRVGLSTAQVKWPNDLVVDGRKVGGLLIEMVSDKAGGKPAFLLGIGINVAQTDFVDSERYVLPPTSVRLAFGSLAYPAASEVVEGVATELEEAFDSFLSPKSALIENWRTYQMIGHPQTGVSIENGLTLRGVYRDVRDEDGAGIIETSDGSRMSVLPSAT